MEVLKQIEALLNRQFGFTSLHPRLESSIQDLLKKQHQYLPPLQQLKIVTLLFLHTFILDNNPSSKIAKFFMETILSLADKA